MLSKALEKCPTGINGFDEITRGGLPQGRPSLICGQAGCGKTLLAMEFLVHGAVDYGEPGVFVTFEETESDLAQNFASLGFDLQDLTARQQVLVDYVKIERQEIAETGEYDLEGLFIRLGHAIDSIGAQRVVLDTIEVLFSAFLGEDILRAELRRLFRWLKDKGVTAVVTGERGERTLTRHGLEEYVADCVILLEQRLKERIATRYLRIIKYRGSNHGTDEYPFLIGDQGIQVLPITSLMLEHQAPTECLTSGIPGLDAMLDCRGFYRGASILVSGSAGTGKSSIAAHFACSACARGESCLYFAFEESPAQIIRNMRSIGIDLEPYVQQGLLRFQANRATAHGLELHLATMHQAINDFHPGVVIIDPVSNLSEVGSQLEVKSMLTRIIDFLKMHQITGLYTSLSHGAIESEMTEAQISSLMDTWLLIRGIESNGERNRTLYIMKSRGMGHSNQVREFLITNSGIQLQDVYLGPEGVLTGSARTFQESRDQLAAQARRNEIERKQREIDQKRQLLQMQTNNLHSQREAEIDTLQREIEQLRRQEADLSADRESMTRQRQGNTSPAD